MTAEGRVGRLIFICLCSQHETNRFRNKSIMHDGSRIYEISPPPGTYPIPAAADSLYFTVDIVQIFTLLFGINCSKIDQSQSSIISMYIILQENQFNSSFAISVREYRLANMGADAQLCSIFLETPKTWQIISFVLSFFHFRNSV